MQDQGFPHRPDANPLRQWDWRHPDRCPSGRPRTETRKTHHTNGPGPILHLWDFIPPITPFCWREQAQPWRDKPLSHLANSPGQPRGGYSGVNNLHLREKAAVGFLEKIWGCRSRREGGRVREEGTREQGATHTCAYAHSPHSGGSRTGSCPKCRNAEAQDDCFINPQHPPMPGPHAPRASF